MLPKKEKGGDRIQNILTYYVLSTLYIILTLQKREYFLGPTIHPRYIGEMQEAEFFFFLMHNQLQSDCVLGSIVSIWSISSTSN